MPGSGKVLINVGNGNLLFQSSDMGLRERGIDLAFHRTYNSQSMAASVKPFLGNGWTSAFEASIGYNAAANTLTVFDIDGAAYTYTGTSTPNGMVWSPPAGQHATLAFDGCSYAWTKKFGSVYKFAPPDITSVPSSCGYTNPAQDNRVMMIVGRDILNYITFTYSFDASGNVTQLVAAHANNQSFTLTFNTNHLLASITRSVDGATATYAYDANNNLSCVNGLTNNTGYNTQCFTWNASGRLASVSSPRWQQTSGVEGGFTSFTYDTLNHVTSVTRSGIANYTPNDASNGQRLQPSLTADSASSPRLISQANFSYTGSQTELTDVDGHALRWTYDQFARVTQTQAWNGSLWLTGNSTWDSNNDVISTLDVRSYETDYAYDSTGNLVAVESPSTITSQGNIRPTTLYSYDASNNLRSVCDPSYTLAHSLAWTIGAAPPACPSTIGTASAPGPSVYTWSTSGSPQYDANEPYGRLTDSYTPMGYHETYTYAITAQGGDYGLPSEVAGAAMVQDDGTTRTPDMSFVYDSTTGDVIKFTNLPLSANAWHVYTYDGVGHALSVADADGHIAYRCYFANGQVAYSETSEQHVMDNSPPTCQNTPPQYADAATYDSDGDVKTQTRHFNNVTGAPGQTTNWYDGADRLVEVQQPQDNSDVYDFPSMTRYIYDLSQNSATGQSIGGVYFAAHGNLAKTQECLASQIVSAPYGTKPTACTFMDTKGQAFDGLDRPVTKYSYSGANMYQEAYAYDAQMQYGLLVSDCTGSLPCKSFTYSALGETISVAHNDGGVTPDFTYTYDADGRSVSIAYTGTTQAQSYEYDSDGRVTAATEPTVNSYQEPARLTYHYYPDGKRESLDIASAALNQTALYKYSYRQDGIVESQQINAGFAPSASTTLTFGYTNGGRETGLSFTGSGAPSSSPTYTYDQYGQELSETVGTASQTQRTYDAEGELTSYQVSGQTSLSNFVYSTRGELVSTPPTSATSFTPAAMYANGIGLNAGSATVNSVTIATSGTIDARMGALTSWSEKCVSSCSISSGPCVFANNGTGCPDANFSYDAVGRMTSKTTDSYKKDDTGALDDVSTATTNAYDTENRAANTQQITTDESTGNTKTKQQWYGWGPNGHPLSIGFWETNNAGFSSRQTQYLHWDGDQLLFVTSPTGQLVDVKVGLLADITPTATTPITFYGRNPAGDITLCYSGTTVTGSFGFQKPRFGSATCAGVGYSFSDGSGGATGSAPIYLGRDGLYDGLNTVQGVRVFDSDAGTWTTPDAYAGVIEDPTSQKSYTWNHDNSVSYADPSGYAPIVWDANPQSGGAVTDPITIEHVQPDDTKPQGPPGGGLEFGPSVPVSVLLPDGTLAYDVSDWIGGQKDLDRHYKKHVTQRKEFPGYSQDDYTNAALELRAQALAGNPNVKVKYQWTLTWQDYVVYNVQTNEFAVYAIDGKIITFYKPDDGIERFNSNWGMDVPKMKCSPFWACW